MIFIQLVFIKDIHLQSFNLQMWESGRKADAKMADLIKTHIHVLEDGSVIEHTHVEEQKHEDEMMHGHRHIHNGEHTHTHGHTHQNTKAVLNRLSRAIGHLESIRRMVEDGRDCTEVLIQLSAVKSALNNTGKVILQDHIQHCIVDAVREGDAQALEELNKAIDRFMK